MRPQSINCGNVELGREVNTLLGASMRPQSINCGNITCCSGFCNGAADCFNEAAVYQLRKSRRLSRWDFGLCVASMRPQSINCGNIWRVSIVSGSLQ